MTSPQISLAFPTLPPALDGIGDHTARLAEALAREASVRVLTAQSDPSPIPGVTVEQAFSYPPRRGVWSLTESVPTRRPDWLLVQFNQFSWGRWGFNPILPVALSALRTRCPEMRLAVLFHEDFLPAASWKDAIMTTWQRAQFWALGRLADLAFFSIAPWVRTYDSWFPNTPVHHLPVGSNIPRHEASRTEIRRSLGFPEEAFVMGVFGSLHESRLLSHIRHAARSVARDATAPRLLYIGPHGDSFARAMDELCVHDAGCLPPAEVSRHFRAMDLYLAPFVDGVSTRRGSFMTGLQHGIPTVSTIGPLTDPLLQDANDEAHCLAPVDSPGEFARMAHALWNAPQRRVQIGRAGRAFYNTHFAFDVVADRLLNHLSMEVTA